jgi:hypothetical protein
VDRDALLTENPRRGAVRHRTSDRRGMSRVGWVLPSYWTRDGADLPLCGESSSYYWSLDRKSRHAKLRRIDPAPAGRPTSALESGVCDSDQILARALVGSDPCDAGIWLSRQPVTAQLSHVL